ncbi:alpha/beta hydrolase fold domain-containing protein [Gemmatimonadota bacterium]
MDLYLPSSEIGPYPCILLVSENGATGSNRNRYRDLGRSLARNGLAAAAIDYRGAREMGFPGAIEDGTAAVRWLQAHAIEYQLDASAIGVLGEGFGGYLAAMLGVSHVYNDRVGQIGVGDSPPLVQSVLAVRPILDLEAYNDQVKFPWQMQVFLGYPYAQNPDLWRKASPTSYISPRAARFLFVHASDDPEIPVQQSISMRDALAGVGVQADLVSPDGAGTSVFDPADSRTQRNVRDYFRRSLAFPPKGVQRLRDLVYASRGERDLRLDLYLPSYENDARAAVIFIHGGGWAFGNKEEFQYEAAKLASSGFVTASIEYRLSSERIYPAAVDDAKAAVRWLRANADLYRIHPDKIGVAGLSAGGHLASLLGVTGDRTHFMEGGENLEVSARVQAVASISGAYDMVDADRRDLWAPASFMGGLPQASPHRWTEASPTSHVGPDSAPFLFLHGTEDELTPGGEAERMVGLLQEAGVHAEMFWADGGGHDFLNAWPWQERVLKVMEDFFGRVLR